MAVPWFPCGSHRALQGTRLHDHPFWRWRSPRKMLRWSDGWGSMLRREAFSSTDASGSARATDKCSYQSEAIGADAPRGMDAAVRDMDSCRRAGYHRPGGRHEAFYRPPRSRCRLPARGDHAVRRRQGQWQGFRSAALLRLRHADLSRRVPDAAAVGVKPRACSLRELGRWDSRSLCKRPPEEQRVERLVQKPVAQTQRSAARALNPSPADRRPHRSSATRRTGRGAGSPSRPAAHRTRKPRTPLRT